MATTEKEAQTGERAPSLEWQQQQDDAMRVLRRTMMRLSETTAAGAPLVIELYLNCAPPHRVSVAHLTTA